MTLNEHLIACIEGSDLIIGRDCAAARNLADALAADPRMAEEARVMIEAAQGIHSQRCHITQWRTALLRRALAMGDA